MQFSIQNLTNDQHIKDFDARVVVTSDQRLFKFENITAHEGDFSVKYIFPDDGTQIRDEQNDIGRWISIVLIIVIPILVLISIIAIVKKKI